jgi:hypothetical protein
MENNTQTLTQSLVTLLGQRFSKASLPIIEKACDAAKLTFRDPLDTILLDDNIEICGRINNTDWFDVTFNVTRGWHASTQHNGETQKLTGYYDCKFSAFTQALISTLKADVNVECIQSRNTLFPEQIVLNDSVLTCQQGDSFARAAAQVRSLGFTI